MANIRGVVEVVMTNKFDADKLAVKLEGDATWYGQKKEFMDKDGVPWQTIERGDTLEFSGGTTGKYLQYLKIIKAGNSSAVAPSANVNKGNNMSRGTFPIGVQDSQRSIIRQNSLTNAVNFTTEQEVTPAEVIAVAREFEAYSTGDMDVDMYKELTAE